MGAEVVSKESELTVCEIMGDWGVYQWSLTLFALIYSALFSMTVCVGPLWTPELRHVCKPPIGSNATLTSAGGNPLTFTHSNFSNNPHECNLPIGDPSKETNRAQELECASFIYDDQDHGKVLTNSFDLVCSRRWLRSFISSSALTGMALSSVTLGLLSDQFGRMSCVRVGFAISILATIAAILAQNYFLLNICFMFMSYSQVGVANALCTLVMEATSPRFRFVPVFQYGIGWGLGLFVAPLLNMVTKDYQLFLAAMLGWQVVMLLWLRLGVFESIRWLLSEGEINRAQIELQRGCRMNRVRNGAVLAQKIAQVQAQQVRKASSVIADKLAPAKLARSRKQEVDSVAHELCLLNAAIRRSFALSSPESRDSTTKTTTTTITATDTTATRTNGTPLTDQASEGFSGKEKAQDAHEGPSELSSQADYRAIGVSPTLNRESFSLADSLRPSIVQVTDLESPNLMPKNSITTQALIELTLKYSKALHKQEEGGFFLIQLFHKKLWRSTTLLIMLSLMLETGYYGLIQANKFVGSSVNLNYMVGAIGEFLAAFIYMIILWLFSRRFALIAPTLLSSLVCFGMALAYQFIPDQAESLGNQQQLTAGLFKMNATNMTAGYADQTSSLVLDDHISSPINTLIVPKTISPQNELIELRETINFWLMQIGKLTITVAIQIASTIAMETYPNNLRQTGQGFMVLVGRCGSIAAPFLFNDSSKEKLLFKSTLLIISAIGFVVCLVTPIFIRDNKNKELCDRLDDIRDYDYDSQEKKESQL